MTSNLIPRPNTELSSAVFTKKTSLIARGLNEISLLKPSPESLYHTGMDYYEGSNGKPWDILKAYAYLVKSAEQGFVLAQWRIASRIRLTGCGFDLQSAEWLAAATRFTFNWLMPNWMCAKCFVCLDGNG